VNKWFFSVLFLLSFTAAAQSVFTDDLPQVPHEMPEAFHNFYELSNEPPPPAQPSPVVGDEYLPGQLKTDLKNLSAKKAPSCTGDSSYLYTLSLTVKGQFQKCYQQVETCIRSGRGRGLPVATLIQAARCAKLDNQLAKAYQLLDAGHRSDDFQGEGASSLTLDMALYAQFSMYADKTDAIIAAHPTWSAAEKDLAKSLIEFVGSTTPVKNSKEEVLNFLNSEIEKSPVGFYNRLLKMYRFQVMYNEHRYEDARNYLIKDVKTLINPLDWWDIAFYSQYALSDGFTFNKALQIYNAYYPYTNMRSKLPVEQNVYNYTQITNQVCKDTMLTPAEETALNSEIDKWKNGDLSLAELLKKLKASGAEQSRKSNLLSTYAGLLVVSGQLAQGQEFYWKAHQACPYNNRSHWGMRLIERKKRYAVYPDYQSNINKMKAVVSKVTFPAETAEYFLNWNSLPVESHERIKYGSRILAPFISELNNTRIYRTYIKMPFELLSRSPGYSDIRDQRISYPHDNRLWDDVRGLGGNVVIADHDETFESVQGDYNLLGHEMVHQLHFHMKAAYPALANCIERLYSQAKRKDTFPDRYAATNSMEYFAQAITYYLIPADSPARFGTNQSWYPKHDPDMYNFILSIESSQGNLNSVRCPREE